MGTSIDPEIRPWTTRVPEEEAADRRRPDDPSRLRGNEIDEAIVESRWRDGRRADLRRTLLESALLLAFVTLLIAGVRLVPLAMALLVGGPAAGAAIHATRAGCGGCAVLGALGFLCFVAPATFHFQMVGLVLGCPFAAIAFAAYGVRRDSRAFVGWE